MSFDAHVNLAGGLVTVAPSTPTAGLTMTVAPSAGVVMPAAPFSAVVAPVGVLPAAANAEVVRVSVNASGVWTMTRAQEGSSARTILVGDQVFVGFTAKVLTDIESAVTTNTAQIATNTGAISAETTRATTAEAQIPTNTAAIAAETSARSAADALLAPLASPALTGNPTVPTQAAGNNSTRAASTSYADGAVATEASARTAADATKITAGAAAIVNADVNAAAAIAESKLNLATDAAAGTGSRRTLGTGATQAAAGNDSRLADARTPTTHAATHASAGSDPVTLAESQVTNLVSDMAAKAPLASPALTGTPTAPTATALDNTTKLATTAYADAAVAVEAAARVTQGLQFAKGLTPTAVKTANYTAAAGDLVVCDSSAGTFTVTLPNAPADKTRIAIKKVDLSTTIVTFGTSGADVFNRAGGATTSSIVLSSQGYEFQYQASGAIWYILNTALPLSLLDARYTSKGYAADVPDASGLYPPQGSKQPWVAATDLVSQFESGHGWTGSAGFVANDTTDFITGVQSSKITTGGTGAYKIESPTVSLDLTGKQIRVRLKVDDITNVNSVNLYAGNDAAYTNGYKWFVQGTLGGSNNIISGGTVAQQGWCVFVLNVADAQPQGSPTRTGIVKIKVDISRTAAAGEVTLHVDEVDFVAEPMALYPNGAAIICFDDTDVEQWTQAKTVLDPLRYRANFFTLTDQVGIGSNRMTADELRVLQDEGHEIHAHMYTDADHALTYTGLTAAALDADLRAQKAWMRAQGFRGEGTAYPKGQYGFTTDGVATHSIARKYFSFARADTNGTNKGGGTYPIGDPYRLPALSTITSFSGGFLPATLVGTGVGSLTAVAANHGVKMMVFHKVVTGAAAAADEISLTDFQTIINKVNTLGMQVITFGEYLAATTPVSGAPTGSAGGDLAGTYPNPTVKSSVSLSGVPTAPTAAVDTNTTQIASTAMVLAQAASATALPAGTASAVGTATRFARADHVHPTSFWLPGDSVRIAEPYPPEAASSSTALATAGTLYVVRVKVAAAANVTGVVGQITTAGVTLTAGQCFAAIFQAGTLLGTSADQAASWVSAGVKRIALASGPFAVVEGYVDIAMFFNGTTGPTWARGNGNALINDGLATTTLKYATADTGRTTTMPATLGAKAALSVSYWWGLY